MITLLQHTHKSLPHYDDKEWDWLRGALCTVDRSFGPFLNVMHHHIADTHVSHHLFSQVQRDTLNAILRALLYGLVVPPVSYSLGDALQASHFATDHALCMCRCPTTTLRTRRKPSNQCLATITSSTTGRSTAPCGMTGGPAALCRQQSKAAGCSGTGSEDVPAASATEQRSALNNAKGRSSANVVRFH